jgi:hypothetical protein
LRPIEALEADYGASASGGLASSNTIVSHLVVAVNALITIIISYCEDLHASGLLDVHNRPCVGLSPPPVDFDAATDKEWRVKFLMCRRVSVLKRNA